MKVNEKSVGIAGLGYWGKNVLRNLHELGVLHAACDTDIEVIDKFRGKYPDIVYTTSIQDLLESTGTRAIVISSPATTHYDFVKSSLIAGKDVYVEKPLALTVKDGEELVALAKEKKKILMVGHILQYHPAVVKLKEIIESGMLGRVEYIYSNRLNIGKLRTEENILWSFAPHDISVILMLLGEEPSRVESFGSASLNRDIYDTTLTSLEFRNGVKGHIFVSWLHPFKEQKLVVVGSKAMAVFDDVSSEKLFLYPHKIKWQEGKIPVAEKVEYEIVPFAEGEPLKLELKHFLECVQTRKDPKTDGSEGLRVLRILETAEHALKVQNSGKGVARKNAAGKVRYFVHETSYIDNDVEIGEGTGIWHFSHVLKGSRLGKNCKIGQNVVIGPNATLGNNVKIQNNVSVYEGVTLEDSVFCGPSMVFTNVFNPRSEIPRMSEKRETLVKRGATIGANATILCGNTIGKYSLIGAGSVVTKDVPDYAMVMGNPAKHAGWVCRCGEKLRKTKTKLSCSACGNIYKFFKNKVEVVEENQ